MWHERGPFSVDAVYLALDRRVAARVESGLTIKAVYAYDAGALATFRAARERGLACIYEHPTIYWRMVRQFQREEAELHPEWAPTLGALADSDEKLARKDEELALADLVVTASTFCQRQRCARAGAEGAYPRDFLWHASRRCHSSACAGERQVAGAFCRSAQPGERARLFARGSRAFWSGDRVYLDRPPDQSSGSGPGHSRKIPLDSFAATR